MSSPSLSEISIAVRAENKASNTFRQVALDVASLGAAFGVLTNDQVKFVSIAFTAVRVVESLGAILKATSVAHYLEAAACWVANTAMTALNISFATFLALTGVGIAAIVTAAAVMASFASSMNNASASVQNFNSVAAETPSASRSITRSGDSIIYQTRAATDQNGSAQSVGTLRNSEPRAPNIKHSRTLTHSTSTSNPGTLKEHSDNLLLYRKGVET
ncbi:MAG: hypothetical protein ACFCUE_04350 [Candidatus Bathyarchaeia archaeon]